MSLTKERSEWRDPWLLTSVVAYVAFWLAVLGLFVYKAWVPQ